jgi:hypothetical protein
MQADKIDEVEKQKELEDRQLHEKRLAEHMARKPEPKVNPYELAIAEYNQQKELQEIKYNHEMALLNAKTEADEEAANREYKNNMALWSKKYGQNVSNNGAKNPEASENPAASKKPYASVKMKYGTVDLTEAEFNDIIGEIISKNKNKIHNVYSLTLDQKKELIEEYKNTDYYVRNELHRIFYGEPDPDLVPLPPNFTINRQPDNNTNTGNTNTKTKTDVPSITVRSLLTGKQ